MAEVALKGIRCAERFFWQAHNSKPAGIKARAYFFSRKATVLIVKG